MNPDVILNIFSFLDAGTIIDTLSLVNRQWYECTNNNKFWKYIIKNDPRFENMQCTPNYRKLCHLFCTEPSTLTNPNEEYVFLDFVHNLKTHVKELRDVNSNQRVSKLDSLIKQSTLIKNRLESQYKNNKILAKLNQKASNYLIRHLDYFVSNDNSIVVLKSKFVFFHKGMLLWITLCFQEEAKRVNEEFEDDVEFFQKINAKWSLDDQLVSSIPNKTGGDLFTHGVCLPAKSSVIKIAKEMYIPVSALWSTISDQIRHIMVKSRFQSDLLEDDSDSITKKVTKEMKRMNFVQETTFVDSSSDSSSQSGQESDASHDSFIDDEEQVEEVVSTKKSKLVIRQPRQTLVQSDSDVDSFEDVEENEVEVLEEVDTSVLRVASSDDEEGEELNSDVEVFSQNTPADEEYLQNDSFIDDMDANEDDENESFQLDHDVSREDEDVTVVDSPVEEPDSPPRKKKRKHKK